MFEYYRLIFWKVWFHTGVTINIEQWLFRWMVFIVGILTLLQILDLLGPKTEADMQTFKTKVT